MRAEVSPSPSTLFYTLARMHAEVSCHSGAHTRQSVSRNLTLWRSCAPECKSLLIRFKLFFLFKIIFIKTGTCGIAKPLPVEKE